MKSLLVFLTLFAAVVLALSIGYVEYDVWFWLSLVWLVMLSALLMEEYLRKLRHRRRVQSIRAMDREVRRWQADDAERRWV